MNLTDNSHDQNIENQPFDVYAGVKDDKDQDSPLAVDRLQKGQPQITKEDLPTLEQALNLVKTDGRYQNMIMLLSILSLFGCAFLTYNLSFTAEEPYFLCPDRNKPGSYVSCTEETACSSPGSKHYFKFEAWTKTMGLFCDKAHVRETGKFLALLVNSITCWIFLNLADIKGRKWVLLVNTLIIIASLVGAGFIDHFYVKMILMGMAYGCEGTFSSLFVFIMNEATLDGSRHRSLVPVLCLLSFSVGIVFLNLMSFLFHSANSLLFFYIFVLAALMLPNLTVIHESPAWLAQQGRGAQCVKILRKIALTNGTGHESEAYLNRLEESKAIELEKARRKEESQESFFSHAKKVLCHSETLKPLIILAVVCSALFCMYYGIAISVQDLGFEKMQFNGITTGILQGLGFVVALPFVQKTPRKTALLGLQALLLLFSLGLLVLSLMPSSKTNKLIQGLIANVFISLTISPLFSFSYLANAESFSPEIRGMCVGTIFLTGKIVGSLAPFITAHCQEKGLHVLTGCALPMILSFLLTFWLREPLEASREREHSLMAGEKASPEIDPHIGEKSEISH